MPNLTNIGEPFLFFANQLIELNIPSVVKKNKNIKDLIERNKLKDDKLNKLEK